MANEGETGTVETVTMNDRELFESATAEPEAEATPEAAAEPTPEPEPRADATGRLHGEGGKFAPKPKAEPAQAEPEQPQHIDHRVPLTELLNEREKRQRFEQEIAEERRQREALQRRVAELSKPQEPPKTPDIFEDPQGFTTSLEQKFEQRLRQQETNFSFRLAHRQHGQDFETAYQALIREGEMGNRQTVHSVMASADPGEALMKWHRQATLYEKTGGDLDKYLQTQREQLLSDPEFLKQAAEKIRAQASGANGQRPASVVQLPPSLNRVPAAAAVIASGDDDMSDAALFRHAMGR